MYIVSLQAFGHAHKNRNYESHQHFVYMQLVGQIFSDINMAHKYRA